MLKPVLGTQLNHGHPLAQGLVGCWLLNEGCGDKVYDQSGNSNIGTLTNMAGTSASGWSLGDNGLALAFDGNDDYVNITNNIFNATPAGTIIVRFNINTGGVVNYFYCGGETNRLRFYYGSDGKIYAYAGSWVLGTSTISTNTWYTAMLVWDALGARIHLDYSLYSTGGTPGGTAGHTDRERFGADEAGANAMTGKISHVLTYLRALTPNEIYSVVAAPFAMFDQRRIWAVAPSGHVPYFLLIRRA
ncbi:MAG: hypothetical protein JRI80_00210 [Deltaproteobacteria bacterium]|nr:hypothetical protein [Deltaproteobacteria bacterium]